MLFIETFETRPKAPHAVKPQASAYYFASAGAGGAGCSEGLASSLSGSFSVFIYCEFGTLDCSLFLKVANADMVMSLS